MFTEQVTNLNWKTVKEGKEETEKAGEREKGEEGLKGEREVENEEKECRGRERNLHVS